MPTPSPLTPFLIIGAGIAGCALAARLHARGMGVLLLDSAPAAASGASGNPAAALHPLLSVTPSREALFYLEALRYTREWLVGRGEGTGVRHAPATPPSSLMPHASPPTPLFSLCGLTLKDPRAPRLAAAAHYAGELELLSADTVLLKQSGWVRPAALCQALAEGVPFRGGAAVRAVEQTADGYTIRLENEETIAASRIVLACSVAVNALLPSDVCLPLQALGGQLTFLQSTPESKAMLTTVRCGDGYLLPAVDGLHTCGASYRRNDTSTDIRAADTAENLRKAAALAPQSSRLVPSADRASVRCRTADVLPAVGAVAENLFVLTGFASRGLCSAPYAAWLLSEYFLTGAALPEWLTPQRFSGRSYAFQKNL